LRVYSLESKWKELVELAEASLALPASRAWLDLHRMTAEALVGLGDNYVIVANAIRSELRALVQDVPEIRTATLMDDTPACNPKTLAWLDEPKEGDAPVTVEPTSASKPAWGKKAPDPFQVAIEALRKNDKARALEVMRNEIESQPSARGKFLRQLQVAELCIQASAKEIAQPFFDDVKAKIKDFRVAEWEDRALVVQALADLYLYHDATVNNGGERAQIFQQVCRLDPVRALTLK
jgi:type VI secretion system protein ImpA